MQRPRMMKDWDALRSERRCWKETSRSGCNRYIAYKTHLLIHSLARVPIRVPAFFVASKSVNTKPRQTITMQPQLHYAAVSQHLRPHNLPSKWPQPNQSIFCLLSPSCPSLIYHVTIRKVLFLTTLHHHITNLYNTISHRRKILRNLRTRIQTSTF